jgi:hypothetical protein
VAETPFFVEHEGYASVVDHRLILRLLLHPVEDLEEPNVRTDSEISFAEGGEVGEDGVGVGVDVMWLEPIGAKHQEEEL